jgi:hypothetical protein
MLTVAPIGNTNRVTRLSNFNVSSKHRNVTGNDAALIEFYFKLNRTSIFFSYLEPVPIPVNQA